jgi:hypothetical protein
MILRSLDDRLVPRMAAGLRRLLDGVTPGRGGGPVTGPSDEEPSGQGALLGLLRDVPQLAALLAAVVFLAVAGLFLLVRSGDDRLAAPTPGPTSSATARPSLAASDAVLGPRVGTGIDAYLARAAARTAQLAVQDPAARRLALVVLADYTTPQAVAELLEPVDVRHVYLRAPAAGELAEVFEVTTSGELAPTLSAFYDRTATAKQADAAEFQGLADSIEVTNEEEEEAKQAYLADVERAAAEAAAYAADCACVFAALVEGPARALVALADDPLVRGVEPADRSATLAGLQVFPLQPQHEGVVPPPPVPGGPTIPGEDGE